MSYDLNEILTQNLLQQWDGDDYFLLRYLPKRYNESVNEARRLILDFKNNIPEAVGVVKALVFFYFEKQASYFSHTWKCRYIVSIPSSRAGKANSPGEQVCAYLADQFNWLTHLPGALERTENVQKSAYANPGMRPDYDDHLRTIRYAGPHFTNPMKNFIMFDDVITRKVTSQACRDIILNATRCHLVKGIYLGRTMH